MALTTAEITSKSLQKLKLAFAPDAWNLLNGVFCVYKPRGTSVRLMKDQIINHLCKDLNQMKVREPMKRVKIEGSVEQGNLVVTNVPSLIDTPEVLGPRYQSQDFKIAGANYLEKLTSGVCVMALNKGCWQSMALREGNHIRTFEVCGRFGYATRTFEEDGLILEKATYDHIRLPHVEKLLASWQAAHQKLMFEFSGVDPQSQEAYELAVKGPIRPANKSVPILYGIKCTKLDLPDFALEIDCINENQEYLMSLINQLGLRMKSAAVCTKIRCTRFAHFTVDLALLKKHWTVEHILTNIVQCKHILREHSLLPDSAIITNEEKHTEDEEEDSIQ